MLELDNGGTDVKSEVTTLIRQDLRAHLLYLMPRHQNFVFDNAWLASQTKLDERDVAVLTSRFLQTGLWTISPESAVSIAEPMVELIGGGNGGMLVTDYMTLASQVLTELTETGHCWYEFEMIPTTQALKAEFLKKVFDAIQDVKAKSAKIPSDTVLAWTNVSLQVLGPKKGNGT